MLKKHMTMKHNSTLSTYRASSELFKCLKCDYCSFSNVGLKRHIDKVHIAGTSVEDSSGGNGVDSNVQTLDYYAGEGSLRVGSETYVVLDVVNN